MSRAAFRQADFERVVRGAMAAGGNVAYTKKGDK